MKLQRVIAAGASIAVLGLVTTGMSAQAVVPDAGMNYSFNNSLVDAGGASTLTPAGICASPGIDDLCNATEAFGSDADGNYWTWTSPQHNGGGIVLTTAAPLGTTYTFSMKFSISGYSQDENYPNTYSKLIDFTNLSNDNGMYYHGIGPFTVASATDEGSTTYGVNEVATMTIVRDDSGTVNVYMTTAANGTELAFTADDSSALDYVAADSNGGSIVRLFQEDPSNIEETSEGVPGGKLYGFEAWPGVALTEEEVTEAVASLGSQGSAAASQAPALASTGVDGAAASWLGALSALAMLGGALVLQRVRRQNAA